MRLIIIVVAAVLVVVVAAFAGFTILGPALMGGGEPAQVAEQAAEPAAEHAAPAKAEAEAEAPAKKAAKSEEAEGEHTELGPLVEVPERIVNLNGEGAYSVLQITMKLEFEPTEAISKAVGEARHKLVEEFQLELAPVVAALEDGVNTIIAKKNGTDLNTPEGKELLKQEIIEMANKFTKEPVVGVYFTKFFLQ